MVALLLTQWAFSASESAQMMPRGSESIQLSALSHPSSKDAAQRACRLQAGHGRASSRGPQRGRLTIIACLCSGVTRTTSPKSR